MDTDLVVVDEQEQQIAHAARSWLADAEELDIQCADDAQMAADFLTEDIAPRRKAVEDFFAPLAAAAFASHRLLTQRRAAILEQFEAPERIVKAKLSAWQATEVERQRIADEAVRVAREQSGGALVLPALIEPTKLDGVAFVETYKAEVVDLVELCRAVAEGRIATNVVAPDMKVLNQLARALTSAFVVPGCRLVKESNVRRVA